MNIIFYSVQDSDNTINKTKVNGLTLSINLKQVSDVTNLPLKLLETDTFKAEDYNYCEIPDLGRFYFMDTIQRLNNKMVDVQLTCDVIETYKNDVLNSVARFNRNIKQGDYYEAGLDNSSLKVVSKHQSDVALLDTESLILTTIGY